MQTTAYSSLRAAPPSASTSRVPSAPAAAAAMRPPGDLPRNADPHAFLQREIDAITNWANDIRKSARRELLWFWALKAPALLIPASYAFIPEMQLSSFLTIAGPISALCLVVDGMFRPGNLHNVHRRAHFRLRALANELAGRWADALLEAEPDLNRAARRLIDLATARKAKISNMLEGAEVLGESALRPAARKSGDGHAL